MNFNYRRNIPPNPMVIVPRIVRPLDLPKHTETVISQVDCDGMPFLISKKIFGGRVIYIHRAHNHAIIVSKPKPPKA